MEEKPLVTVHRNTRSVTPLGAYGNIDGVEARNGFIIFKMNDGPDRTLDWKTAMFYAYMMSIKPPADPALRQALVMQLQAINEAVAKAKSQVDDPSTAEERAASKWMRLSVEDNKVMASMTPLHRALLNDWCIRYGGVLAEAEIRACMRAHLRNPQFVPLAKVEDVIKSVYRQRADAARERVYLPPTLTAIDKKVSQNVAAGETRFIFPKDLT